MTEHVKARTCVICGKPLTEAATASFGAFCSARCRQIDLGRWLGERYRVADAPQSSDEDAARVANSAEGSDEST